MPLGLDGRIFFLEARSDADIICMNAFGVGEGLGQQHEHHWEAAGFSLGARSGSCRSVRLPPAFHLVWRAGLQG